MIADRAEPLQWGREQMLAETFYTVQFGDGTSRFNGAASRCSRKRRSLQTVECLRVAKWGREQMLAKQRDALGRGHVLRASMGPRADARGNGVSGAGQVWMRL